MDRYMVMVILCDVVARDRYRAPAGQDLHIHLQYTHVWYRHVARQ